MLKNKFENLKHQSLKKAIALLERNENVVPIQYCIFRGLYIFEAYPEHMTNEGNHLVMGNPTYYVNLLLQQTGEYLYVEHVNELARAKWHKL